MSLIITIIVFIIFMIWGPNFFRKIYIKRMSNLWYQEENQNSKNESAGNLIAKRIFLANMDTQICVDKKLLDGESYYHPISDEIHIGKDVDLAKNMSAVAECYHELGHAIEISSHGKHRRARLEYANSCSFRRKLIPVSTMVGSIGLVIMGIIYITENTISIPFIFAAIIGFTVTFLLQNKEIQSEKAASDLAINMLIEDGFTNEEVAIAENRLEMCLKTYKMELVINAMRWIGIVCLFLVVNGVKKK